MRAFFFGVLLAPLALAACGSDEQPVIVNTPPAAAAPSTTVVPAPAERPVVVVPRQ